MSTPNLLEDRWFKGEDVPRLSNVILLPPNPLVLPGQPKFDLETHLPSNAGDLRHKSGFHVNFHACVLLVRAFVFVVRIVQSQETKGRLGVNVLLVQLVV